MLCVRHIKKTPKILLNSYNPCEAHHLFQIGLLSVLLHHKPSRMAVQEIIVLQWAGADCRGSWTRYIFLIVYWYI